MESLPALHRIPQSCAVAQASIATVQRGCAARNGSNCGRERVLASAHASAQPRMVVAIALANKMARSLWALLVKQENYRDPMAALA